MKNSNQITPSPKPTKPKQKPNQPPLIRNKKAMKKLLQTTRM